MTVSGVVTHASPVDPHPRVQSQSQSVRNARAVWVVWIQGRLGAPQPLICLLPSALTWGAPAFQRRSKRCQTPTVDRVDRVDRIDQEVDHQEEQEGQQAGHVSAGLRAPGLLGIMPSGLTAQHCKGVCSCLHSTAAATRLPPACVPMPYCPHACRTSTLVRHATHGGDQNPEPVGEGGRCSSSTHLACLRVLLQAT